jgi:hypothetical protein
MLIMKLKLLISVLLLAVMNVNADVTIFSENFNSEGNTALNYSTFAQWTVSDGTVDLITTGASGIECVDGNCVDLDGSTSNSGVLSTSQPLNLESGTYRLTFSISGNQRRSTTDTVTVSFGTLYTETFIKGGSDPFESVVREFQVPSAQSAYLTFENSGGDNVGIILDDVLVEKIACTGDITPTDHFHRSSAESGTVTVSASPECSWTATSNTIDWATITFGENGEGDGTVVYEITENPNHQPREGTLTIAGQTFTITQEGIECTYSITPTSDSHSSNTETGEVNVIAPGDCPWTARSDITWANITSGGSGNGNGTVTYAIMENTGATRNGTLTIAEQTFTLTQAGPIDPPPEDNQPPVANFTAEPSQGQAPLEVTLDASDSFDPDGTIVNYAWFVNEQLLSGQTASTTLTAAGEYSVILIVTDDQDATGTSQQTIIVRNDGVFMANIAFAETQPIYNVGEIVTINLVETQEAFRLQNVDLWVAISMPSGELLFMTPFVFTPFSIESQAFKLSLDNTKRTHQVFNFEVPVGLGGEYLWYALYVEEGKNPLTEDFFKVMRSNLVVETMTLMDH